jgi:LmbE family N-acetylglucosaminyl deacetylase
MRIAAIHAHPDDLEILAGGTLALLARAGHHLTLVTLSDGDCGSREYSPEDTGRIRREEAARAAALIGATYFWGGFHDLAIFNDDPSRRRVTALIRLLRPDLVLTSAPSDYLADHEMTSLLVRDACFAASAPNYRSAGFDNPPATDRIPHLYFMDPIEGLDREHRPVKPDFIVDVSEVFALKHDMLACHASQRNWLRAQHGLDDYMTTMEQWTRQRGAEGGVRYGEGFRQYTGHPYPQTPLLEELLEIETAGDGDDSES